MRRGIAVAVVVFCSALTAVCRACPDGGAAGGPPLYYERPIIASDLAERSLDELRIMRNTIYARARISWSMRASVA